MFKHYTCHIFYGIACQGATLSAWWYKAFMCPKGWVISRIDKAYGSSLVDLLKEIFHPFGVTLGLG